MHKFSTFGYVHKPGKKAGLGFLDVELRAGYVHIMNEDAGSLCSVVMRVMRVMRVK